MEQQTLMEETKTTVQLAQDLTRLEVKKEKLETEIKEVNEQLVTVKEKLIEKLVES